MAALAFLFLSRDAELTAHDVAAQLAVDWPDLAITTPEANDHGDDGANGDDDGADRGGDQGQDGPHPVVLEVNGSLVALMGSPGQIGDDLAEIAAHSRLWPNAREVPTDYSHHMIVTVFSTGERDHVAALADAVLLSRAVASIVGVTDAVEAVYFGSAGHVIVPELFRELALSVLPAPLLPAWVALNVAARPDGVMTGHTRGLEMLGLMNVEIPESPEDAAATYERLAGITDYLLTRGPVIGDGDTIGSTPVAEIVAHHVPSVLDPEETVIRLTFGVGEHSEKRGFFAKFRR